MNCFHSHRWIAAARTFESADECLEGGGRTEFPPTAPIAKVIEKTEQCQPRERECRIMHLVQVCLQPTETSFSDSRMT